MFELCYVFWVGWIIDFLVLDLSLILNLFGLFNYVMLSLDSFFFVFSFGVLLIILGVFMWL